MTEEQLLQLVIGRCEELQIRVFHSSDSRRDVGRGFPDLVIAGNRGLIFRELKTESGQLESAQKIWKWRLHACRASWALWRPADWQSGRIENELELIR